MSGYVAIINFDGAPVDPVLLRRMTNSMAYRGPDRRGMHLDGPVALGHRLLATTLEAYHEEQPCTLDGYVWMVADARVDDRDRLKRELAVQGWLLEPAVTDDKLILHAYHTWGERCVEHLLGDFSFVIWNSQAQRVFCARDHWGVKLLYYARIKNTLVISNELNCIRLHPDVSNRLNDLAIADYLMFGYNPDLSKTTFEDILRLPPAHWMQVAPQSLQQRQYWGLPHNQQTRFRHPEDYIERFKELLNLAVGDRLRTDRVAILMSGGLDSTTIAATTKRLLSQPHSPSELDTYTLVFDWLIPDDERDYSILAADAIGVRHHIFAVDDTPLHFDHSGHGEACPEPFHWLYYDALRGIMSRIASQGRIVLSGEDGDTLLRPASVAEMLSSQGMWRTMMDTLTYILRYRRRPHFGLGVMERFRRWRGHPDERHGAPPFPIGMNPDLVRRFSLTERWRRINSPSSVPRGTIRPASYRSLTNPFFQTFFESMDVGITRHPVEYCLPLFDVRLSTYLLSLPVLPWCINKALLRESAHGILPEAVRLRRKTPLQNSPLLARLRHAAAEGSIHLLESRRTQEYTNVSATEYLARLIDDKDYTGLWGICLNSWLHLCYDKPLVVEQDKES